MGYFSNGTEGMAYQAEWCDLCVHDRQFRRIGEGGCQLWAAHLIYNGDDGPSKVLNMLIPRTEDVMGNDKCVMFISEGGA